MINSITLGNFKAFADPQTLPLKPITLIFGANSSGKSSIIHSMLLANEALTNDKLNLDIFFTKLGGESVDLGGFRQFVNRRDSDLNVLIGIEMVQKMLPMRLQEIFHSVKKIKIFVEFGMTNLDFDSLNELRIINIEILTDENQFLKMSLKGNGEIQMDVIEIENQVTRTLFEALIASYTTSEKILETDSEIFKIALNELVPKLSAKINKLIPEGLNGLENFIDLRVNSSSPTMQATNSENRAEIIKYVSINVIPFILDEMFEALNKFITKEFTKLVYLGPLRSYPDRHFNLSRSNDINWNAGGGYAWEVVANNEEIRNQVNTWLESDKLKQKYELRVTELIPDFIIRDNLPNELSDVAHNSILNLVLEKYSTEESPDILFNEIIEELENQVKAETGWEDELPLGTTIDEVGPSIILQETISKDFNFNNLADYVLEKFLKKRHARLSDLILFDKLTKTQVSHRDVGIGISQVLPVLVSAFANKEKIISIEQPEIHLHPALQAELGDLFINSALGENKNTFILETHSEHLILRVMRRIRETTNGTLPDGVNPIKSEDVQIVFVEPFEGRSIIRNMPLNEEGELIKSWPGGFFEEGLREVL